MNSTALRLLSLKHKTLSNMASVSVASAKLKAHNARTENKNVVKKSCCGSCRSGNGCESEKNHHH